MLSITVLVAEAGPWTVGWEMLVAFGTIGLAFATAFLAWTTRKVAQETRDVAKATQEEIRANWRPVLLLRDGARRTVALMPTTEGGQPGILLEADKFEIRVVNTGRGPALDLRAELLIDDPPSLAEPQRIAVAPGEAVRLAWRASNTPFETRDVTQMGRLSYADLSYSGYETSFAVVTDVHGNHRLDWQRVDPDPRYEAPHYGP